MSGLLALAGFAVLALRRLLTYLHLFQQEEYDNRRFLVWLVRERAFDQRLSVALFVAWLLQLMLPGVPGWGPGALAGAAALAVAAFEPDPRKTAKKRLVLTARATRIYGVALALLLVVAAAAAWLTGPVIVWIVPVQLVPLALVV